jgi:hypothetical protein
MLTYAHVCSRMLTYADVRARNTPHTTTSVSSYYYILLHLCPHTTTYYDIRVLILLHTTISVSSYYYILRYPCPHTTTYYDIRVLILLTTSRYVHARIHELERLRGGAGYAGECSAAKAGMLLYVCVCPRTTMHVSLYYYVSVSSYCYKCVRIL